jgi:hypothetical protein
MRTAPHDIAWCNDDLADVQVTELLAQEAAGVITSPSSTHRVQLPASYNLAALALSSAAIPAKP